MYLTKLQLDVRHSSVRRCLSDCHDMHRTLMSAFADVATTSARAEVGMLYRVMQGGSPVIWMSSHRPPDEKILEAKGFAVVGTRCMDQLETVLQSGQHLRFQLLAVPAKKVPVPNGNSRRSYLKTEEERVQWLLRKGEQNGFRVHHLVERSEEKIVGTRKDTKLIFTATYWEGVLEITDVRAFWQGMCQGIGVERAYGAGMLMISGV